MDGNRTSLLKGNGDEPSGVIYDAADTLFVRVMLTISSYERMCM